MLEICHIKLTVHGEYCVELQALQLCNCYLKTIWSLCKFNVNLRLKQDRHTNVHSYSQLRRSTEWLLKVLKFRIRDAVSVCSPNPSKSFLLFIIPMNFVRDHVVSRSGCL